MQKGIGIVLVVLLIVVVLVLFWAFRGRPAGEQTGTVVVPPAATSTSLAAGTLPVTAEIPALGVTPPVPQQGSSEISVSATGFSPSSATVPVGGSVTFVNHDTVPHQVASNPHPVHTNYPPFNGPVLGPSQSLTVTFTSAGSFGYHNHLNPGLQGAVVVQ